MKSYKYGLCLILILSFTVKLLGQSKNHSTDHKAVENILLELFDGMREGDSAKVASVFHNDVKMYSSQTNKEGEIVIKEGKLSSFLNAIGTPHDAVWDEKLWNTIIQIDGGIAQVWTDYAFYIGKDFSHCGIDAFDLIKDNKGEWKIIHLMDTRRKNNCKQSD